MRVSYTLRCTEFPCAGVRHGVRIMPHLESTPQSFSVAMLSQATPADVAEYYCGPGTHCLRRP